jgi:hypothetical protein
MAEKPSRAFAMAAIVTLEVFSGRPDPNWPLTPLQQAEFERRVAGAPIAPMSAGVQNEPLGYRGFRVQINRPGAQPSELKVHQGWIRDGQTREDLGRALEQWLLDTGRGSIPTDLANYVGSEIQNGP